MTPCCWLVALSLTAAIAGCGGPPGPQAEIEEVVPVSGTLTYRGSPLEHYQVTFLSTDGRRAAVGTTDANGKFVLGTNDLGDGAPPGRHKVAVVWAGPPAPDAGGQEEIIDDPRLLPKPPVEIPARYGNPETSGLTQEVPDDGLENLRIDLQ